MDVIHKISIDFGRNQIPPYIAVMQKDSARKIEATLYENGAAWNVPSGSSAYIAFRRPDGKNFRLKSLDNEKSVVSFSNNVATVVIPAQVTEISGNVPVVIVFVSGSGSQIATFPIAVSVVENPSAESEESVKFSPDEFTQLLSALAFNSARINNLTTLKEGSTTGDAELIDIRVDIYGTQHATAGEAVRAQILDAKHVEQTFGESETTAMSQKAVSDIFKKGDGYSAVSLTMTDGIFAMETGAKGTTSGTQVSDFISVNEGEKYRVTTWAGVAVPAVVFYHDTPMFSPGQFKGMVGQVTELTYLENLEFTIPSDVMYIAVNARKSAADFTPTLEKAAVEYIENIPEELKKYVLKDEQRIVEVEQNCGESETAVMSQKAVSDFFRKGNISISLEMVDKYFVTDRGADTPFNYAQRSGFIPVAEGEQYRLSTVAGGNVPAAVFFKEAKFGTAYGNGYIGDINDMAHLEVFQTFDFTVTPVYSASSLETGFLSSLTS